MTSETFPRLGVCYYPEHWPETVWPRDAGRMADLGLSQVRIGEFAWGRIEPSPGRFDWGWLDRAIEVLGSAGLGVMLGTPTATPPKWLIDAYPDILALDEQAKPRRFGSRRHYCFSSRRYKAEAVRIVEAVSSRYGAHEAIVAWQTDNEYGCHNTVRSYSADAEAAFRLWLADRYRDIRTLNEAWGCVFWSQEYRSFDEIDLPNLTVTEANPSHKLDFFRFSSDQVAHFNRLQTDIIRRYSPGRDIVHNFMGFYFEFDHFKLAADLDSVGWDSYPIGFLDVSPFPDADKRRYMRQGHPDIAGFHHDLYRACGRGRWQVLEQQPGPVNWAPNNPAPLDGMARLWALEGFAHGAEAVSYFRWRQAPFAQEQMHAGLERPDGEPAPAFEDARQVARELLLIDKKAASAAKVALIFSYDAVWLFEAQRQGAGWSYPELCFEWYAVLRRFGLDIDIVSPETALDDYALVFCPSLPVLSDDFIARAQKAKGTFVFGPRTGSKAGSVLIPPELPPGKLQKLLPVKVISSESFPAFHKVHGEMDGAAVEGRVWLDHIETDLPPLAAGREGGLLYRKDRTLYFATVPSAPFLASLVIRLAQEASVHLDLLPEDVRIRRRGSDIFAFNYGPESISISHLSTAGEFIIGDEILPPAGVAMWRSTSAGEQDA